MAKRLKDHQVGSERERKGKKVIKFKDKEKTKKYKKWQSE